MAKTIKPVGPEFEEAIYRFARSLDPDAEVLFNHSVPDRVTGEPRACDAWINASFDNQWPLSILVSRKDLARKLTIGDMETFRDEIQSTGANSGIIYSRAGFTESAIQSAQVTGIACCRLNQDEPAEIPPVFYFDQFACLTQISLDLLESSHDLILYTWSDIFALEHDEGTVLDLIGRIITEAEASAADEIKISPLFPADWALEIQLGFTETNNALKILVNGHWKKYKARLEAALMDGSYSLKNKTAQGTQSGAWFDPQNAQLGDAWIEMKEEDFTLPTNTKINLLSRGKWKDTLQEKLGSKSPFNELP